MGYDSIGIPSAALWRNYMRKILLCCECSTKKVAHEQHHLSNIERTGARRGARGTGVPVYVSICVLVCPYMCVTLYVCVLKCVWLDVSSCVSLQFFA